MVIVTNPFFTTYSQLILIKLITFQWFNKASMYHVLHCILYLSLPDRKVRSVGSCIKVDAQPFFRITFSMTSRRGSALTAAAFPSWVRGSGGPVDRLRKREVIFLSLKTSIYKFHFVCSLVGFFQQYISYPLLKQVNSVTEWT